MSGNRWAVTLLGLVVCTAARADVGAMRADVDAVFAPWTGPSTPGCALAVLEGPDVVYARGYGMANLETGTPITPESIFDVGSVSKQFTAMAVLMLARDGKLSLEDDIRKYLPEMPDYGATITISNLLHHTSGLRNYTDLFDLAGVPEVSLTTARDAMDLITRQKGVNFGPNREFLYSDTNYFLAGEIVRRVSGLSLREFAARRIFTPLAMTRTHYNDSPREVVPGRAVGYEPTTGGYLNYLSNFEEVGDGSVMTTVLDLARWQRNFDDARFTDRATLDQLMRTARLANGTETPYGMGLFVDQYRGLPWIHHDGEWVGYRAAISRFPSARLSVVVTCNTLGALDAMDLALKVSELYLGDRLQPAAPALPVDAGSASVARRAGLYWSPERGTVRRFEAHNGTLMLGSVSAGEALARVGADEYRSSGEMAATFRFRDEDGSGRAQLQVDSSGNTADYFRMPALDTNTPLNDLTGAYQSADLPNEWHLVVVDGKLVRRQSYMHDTELVPVFADTFIGSLSEGDFLIHFVRDPSGRVSGLLVSGELLRPMLMNKVSAAPR